MISRTVPEQNLQFDLEGLSVPFLYSSAPQKRLTGMCTEKFSGLDLVPELSSLGILVENSQNLEALRTKVEYKLIWKESPMLSLIPNYSNKPNTDALGPLGRQPLVLWVDRVGHQVLSSQNHLSYKLDL